MLKRKINDHLVIWKNKTNKCPLLIEGARQIGKTYSITNFGKNNYQNFIYINFILNPEYKDIFSDALDNNTLTTMLNLYFPNFNLNHETLLFLDEIQDCPNAITALKSLANVKNLDVIASGSLLGMLNNKPSSFPTGYVEVIKMYPLDFEEFLWANGYGDNITNLLIDTFKKRSVLPVGIAKKLLSLFKRYLILGGMPNNIISYNNNNDYNQIQSESEKIINGYFQDIQKYGDFSERNKAYDLFISIPKQLMEQNKKFQFSKIKKHARLRDYDSSLKWIYRSNIINIIPRLDDIEKPQISSTQYKVYINDTGLLVGLYKVPKLKIDILNDNYFVYNQAIIENVIQDTLLKQNFDLVFYKRESGLEIEFLINLNDIFIPISIREKYHYNSSIKQILQEGLKQIPFGFNISIDNFNYQDNTYQIPIYAIYLLKEYIKLLKPEISYVKLARGIDEIELINKIKS